MKLFTAQMVCLSFFFSVSSGAPSSSNIRDELVDQTDRFGALVRQSAETIQVESENVIKTKLVDHSSGNEVTKDAGLL